MPSKKRNRKYVIDSTPFSSVVRCTRCPWRGLSHSKRSSYRLVADHLDRIHKDWSAARDCRRAAMKHYDDFGTTAVTDQAVEREAS